MRTTWIPTLTFGLTMAVAVALMLPGTSHGLSAEEWYSRYRWPAGTSHHYAVQQNFPKGEWRARLSEAHSSWTKNGNSRTPRFYRDLPATDYPPYAGTVCPNEVSTVYYQRPTVDGALATTQICLRSKDNPEIIRFGIVVDPGWPWYAGTGDPAPDQYDLRSTLAHEFGHVTGGWGWQADHFSGAELCPDSAARQTMCFGVRGTTWRRNPDVHDLATFRDAYSG